MFGKSERFEDYEAGGGAMAFTLAARTAKRVPPGSLCRLLLVKSGAIRVAAAGQVWICGKGGALLLAPEEAADLQAVSRCVVHAAFVPPRHVDWHGGAAHRVAASSLLQALVARMVQESAAPSRSARARLIDGLLVDEIRLDDVPAICLPRPSEPRLAMVCDAVLAEPSARWDAPALAALAGMSTRTLARMFVTHLGIAPASWCRSARLLTALTEVARGGTLHEAAAASGFAGPASLCTAFKNATGTTPRHYFRAHRAMSTSDEAQFFDEPAR